MADLRHRFRIAAFRWSKARQAGIPDRFSQRCAAAQPKRVNGPDGSPRTASVPTALRGGFAGSAGPSNARALSQHLVAPAGELRSCGEVSAGEVYRIVSESFRARLALLVRRGGCGIKRKSRSHLNAADGVVFQLP